MGSAWSRGYPSVYLELDGIPADLESSGRRRHGPGCTRMILRTTLPGGLRVVDRRMTKRHQALLGPQDIRVGNPAFEERFLVQGDPVEWAKAIFTPEVCKEFLALADLAEVSKIVSRPMMFIGPMGVAVQVGGEPIRLGARLPEFVERSFTLLRQVKKGQDLGKAVANPPAVVVRGSARIAGRLWATPAYDAAIAWPGSIRFAGDRAGSAHMIGSTFDRKTDERRSGPSAGNRCRAESTPRRGTPFGKPE